MSAHPCFGFDAGIEVGGTYHRRIETPAARSSDPQSSHEAAEHVTSSGMRQRHIEIVIRAVREHPGLTSLELADVCGLERHEVARRTADAETSGAIRKGPPRRQSNGRSAVTWEAE